MKKLFILLSTLLFLISTSTTTAKKGSSEPVFMLPEQAKSTNVVYLGKAKDPKTLKQVEGYAFIKRSDNHAKPDGVGKSKNPKNTACYEFLAKGAKWKTSEPFLVNATNNSSLGNGDVLDVMNDGLLKWEAGAEKDILGSGTLTSSLLEADEAQPDGNNEMYFGAINDPGVIGVTIVWGIFGGRPAGRELVEWDQIYNQVDYGWSLTGDSSKMNFDNIATHELGHTMGMADLYTSECMDETMYGYADYGEQNKIDLSSGDISGIKELYK